ncbi:MAG: chromosome segregation protein SMC [Gammaproteobacteria bacterium]|nr:chromosome segregation protein SMC [Gammaproteobacteria bacterium]
MRLTRIKLAGFKSFVDPVDLKMANSLIGIVGPNGCGKSNTIDAVRWVMGESSAKHLRGESMEDVIFNGTSQRQPVGQASVELIFDNSEGRLGGEYAAYSEISIKREVSRDGISKYLLNNTRCRRRDIRDIFLGTGLGPRSYAIIEQGMISRLIEAKPEDMRVFLEEAAGISKYKERRKETENRIRHTRDNLDRLDDLREEVDKQLAHLKRQANTAERYQEMKTNERRMRGELLGLRRRDYLAESDTHALKIAEKEKEVESVVAELRAAETAIEQARAQQTEATERFNKDQADYYRIGADVSRVEQQIEHTKDTRRAQNQELAEVEKNLEEARTHQREDTARIADIDASMQTDQPAYDSLKDSQKHSAELFTKAERELQQWRVRQDNYQHRFAEATRIAQVELSRIDQLERNAEAAKVRLQRLDEEKSGIDTDGLQAVIASAIAEEVSASGDEKRLQEALTQSVEKQQRLRESIRRSQVEMNESQSELQSSIGRLASLEALQQAALQSDSSAADAWLEMHELSDAPRLAQSITADAGWEKSVELVLQPHLEAICIDNSEFIDRCLNDLPAAQLTLLRQAVSSAPAPDGTLAAKVAGAESMSDVLKSVRAAASLAEALAIRDQLSEGESVITQEGVWLGRNWLRIARADSEDSVLLRETEITELRSSIVAGEEHIQSIEERLVELNTQLDEHETRRETLQHSYNDAVRLLSDTSSGLHANRQQLTTHQSRLMQLEADYSDTQNQQSVELEELQVAKAKRSEALTQLDNMQAEGRLLEEEQQSLNAALNEARQRSEADRDAGQELAIRVESMRSARAATEQNLARMKSRIEQLAQRYELLNQMLAEADDDPLNALEVTLKESLDARLVSEQALATSRSALEEVETRLREHEQARVRHDSRVQGVREGLSQARMDSQEVVVRLKTIEEQINELDYNLEEIVASLPEDATVEVWAADLEKLEQRIARLGPINLAAIDEHTEQSQRKEYLDSQHADVTEALATLERAIAKIDRETRARFKETFDKVNAKFEQFFPRLFGGGHGALQMTGDDLLSTGIGVMAQPPGKRISNIQVLSGGEKALTAVALVFAFFELNPSPFCMLDEVDAPLDDANVGRFCQLVKEMSERVQFIVITHNKVTMEMTDQLMGVTMNEPGVSRLVAVDVQEAAELAGV